MVVTVVNEKGMAVQSHRDLIVYRKAFDLAVRIFELSHSFPKIEQFALTDQIRRSSRSVCANLAEAWRKRRYEAHFVSKLSDAESEMGETQCWLEFALHHQYIVQQDFEQIDAECEEVIRMLVAMMASPTKWCFPSSRNR